MVREFSLDDEYSPGVAGDTGSTGSGATETPPPPSNLWQPGLLVQPGEVYQPTLANGFVYTATQAAAAYTGATEPVWPTTVGGTVVDGGVTWTAAAQTSITWTAVPLYKAGLTQPAWPTVLGGTVVDGTITWAAETPAVTDPKCPQSPIARPMASKVFSPYRDVLRYCATDAPRDWSTLDDAGFLNIGIWSSQSRECTALGEYRGRLAVWTAAGLQVWTVDPDPALMALFDSIPGIGTTFAHGGAPVSGDYLFLSKVGVRSLSIAAGASTLQSGDVGSVIDALVQAKIGGPETPRALYYPGGGQFWLSFGSESYVYSQSRLGKVGAWSRYVFPYGHDADCQLNGDLYIRSGDNLYLIDETALDDDGVEFEGVIEWPFLDLGSPGTTKMLHGVDVVGYGTCTISIGYDQTNAAAVTTPFTIGPDTVPGGIVPIPVAAPSFSLRLVYSGGQAWQLNAANLYLQDFRPPM